MTPSTAAACMGWEQEWPPSRARRQKRRKASCPSSTMASNETSPDNVLRPLPYILHVLQRCARLGHMLPQGNTQSRLSEWLFTDIVPDTSHFHCFKTFTRDVRILRKKENIFFFCRLGNAQKRPLLHTWPVPWAVAYRNTLTLCSSLCNCRRFLCFQCGLCNCGIVRIALTRSVFVLIASTPEKLDAFKEVLRYWAADVSHWLLVAYAVLFRSIWQCCVTCCDIPYLGTGISALDGIMETWLFPLAASPEEVTGEPYWYYNIEGNASRAGR